MSSWGDDSSPAPSDAEGADPTETFEDAGPRYERQGLLGVGGMGKVYAARDGRLRRQVALNVASNPKLAGRLAREAWITAQLEHPGIVAVYDAGESDGQAWYTMRLIRGRTLRERLRACPTGAERLGLLPHFHAATQAVAYAHSMGIIHRDLKPANIMVGEFGETQVADWGLARPVDEATGDWNRIVASPGSTGVAGTPRYMSPEQARGAPATFASDVFCLGGALYEVISGTSPPEEPGVPPDLDTLGDDVPAALVAIARRAVQLDPADRYPSAVELAEDLARWLSGRRVAAHEYTPSELLVRLVQAWRAPLAVGGLALLVLGIVVAVAVKRTTEERAAADANMSLALAHQAQAAQEADRLPEARVLASHALALGPSPLARGVMAATATPPAQRVERLDLPEACQHRGYLSPDATRLACSAEGRLDIYSVPEMQVVFELEMGVVESPRWSGRQLVVGDGQQTLFIEEGEIVDRGPGGHVALSAGGRFYIGASLVSDAEGELRPLSVCLHPRSAVAEVDDGVLIGCTDGRRLVFSPDAQLLSEHLFDLAAPWSATVALGGALFVGRVDGAVQRVQLPEGVGGPLLPGFEGSVGQLQHVPGSSLILARGERGGPRIWNTTVNEWVGSLPAGVSLMSAGTEPGEVWLLGETLDRWVFETSPRPTVLDVTAGITKVALSPEGDRVAIALGDATVVVRSLDDGAELSRWTWGSGVAKCATWVEDGILGSTMGGAAALLTEDGAVHTDPRLIGRRCDAFADGTGWLALYGPGLARVRGLVVTFEPGTEEFVFFDTSASSDRVWGAALDTEGTIWRSEGTSWEPVRVAHDAVSLDITNDGEIVYARRREVCFDQVCRPIEDSILDVSVAARQVAVATLSGDVYLVDLDTMEVVAIMRGHTQRVASVEMGSDGTLVSGGWDGAVRIWDLSGLDTPVEQLVADSEAAWGLTLEEALRTR